MCQAKERGCSLCFNEAIVARRILMIMIMIMMMLIIPMIIIIMQTIKILFTINSRKKKLFRQNTIYNSFRLKKTLSFDQKKFI